MPKTATSAIATRHTEIGEPGGKLPDEGLVWELHRRAPPQLRAHFVGSSLAAEQARDEEDYLAEHGLAPIALTLGSDGAIKHAAQAGLGVSLQSRLAVQLELAQGRLSTIALREPPAARQWYVIRAATGPVREATAAFTSFVTSPAARDAFSVVPST